MKATLKNQITGETIVFEHRNVGYVLSKIFYEAREQMKEYVRDSELIKFEVIIRKGR
jgi:hypothetical protein